MFDAIAERYDLVNGIVAMGMDTGWRRRCIEALGLPPGSMVLDVACGTGDLCRGLARRRLPAGGRGPVPGHALPCPDHRPPGAGGRPARPFPPRLLRRRGQRFRPAQRRRPRRRCSPNSPASPAPAGASRFLDLGAPEAPLLRAGHRIWCDYGVPLVGSVLSDADAYRYLPRSLAYLPPADEMVQPAGAGRLRGRAARSALRRHQPAVHRHPGGPGGDGRHDRGLAPAGPRLLPRPRASRTAPARAPASPRPGELCAVTVPVPLELLGDLVRAGGRPGSRLWSQGETSLLGRGEALRLALPAGWARPDHVSLVSQALSLIGTDDPVMAPGSGPVADGCPAL